MAAAHEELLRAPPRQAEHAGTVDSFQWPQQQFRQMQWISQTVEQCHGHIVIPSLIYTLLIVTIYIYICGSHSY